MRGARLDVHGQAATALRLVPGVPGPGSDRRRRRCWPPGQLDQVQQLDRIDVAGAAGKLQAGHQGTPRGAPASMSTARPRPRHGSFLVLLVRDLIDGAAGAGHLASSTRYSSSTASTSPAPPAPCRRTTRAPFNVSAYRGQVSGICRFRTRYVAWISSDLVKDPFLALM